MAESELKPCPFCGGKAVLSHDHTGLGASYIRCEKCGTESIRFIKSFEIASDDRAKQFWNRRADNGEIESICLRCFHSYVCEQFNEHRDVKNDKCHFYNDHFVPYADVAPVQKWISAKESLPRDSDCVLVIASGKCENITLENAIEIATFDMSEGWILEMWPEWENPKITYWMPLPEPPKEDKNCKES